MKNRLLSLLLTLVMIVGVMTGFTLTAGAEDVSAEAAWGADADNLTQTGSFADALAAAEAENAGDIYIRLQKNITAPDGRKFIVDISADTTLTIDFNGYTVSGCLANLSSTLFDFNISGDTVNADAKLTLLDSSDNPGGISVSEGSPFVSTIPLVVEGGVYEGSGSSYAERSASAVIEGGTFRSTESAALHVRHVDTLTISGGTFRTADAHAFFCFDVGEVNINGGKFSHGTSGAMQIINSSDVTTACKLSGYVVITDATPDDSSVDIVLEYENTEPTIDLSQWTGGSLDVMVPAIPGLPAEYQPAFDVDNITLPNGKWGVFDSKGKAVQTMEINKIYTIKPTGHTVIFYDNSESQWQYVMACFQLDDDVGYEQGTRIGESSLYFLEIPYGVTDIYFTNYMSQMPSEYYPEGIRRTVTFAAEPNKTYGYIPGYDDGESDNEESDDADSSVLQMIMDMMKWRFPSNAIVSEGGTVTADRSFVGYDQDITYTITPDEGYAIADVVVNGKSVGAVSEYTFKNVRRQHKIEVVFEKIVRKNPFTDVSDKDWFYEDVAYVVENGLMNGVGTDHFSPELPVNRAMIVTILWRLEGSPVVNYLMQFEDVPQNEWYSEAVRWAASEGIVLGYGEGTFRPLNDITHEQIAAILQRYAAYKGWDDGLTFPMIPQYTYSTWAENHVIWADRIGLYDSIGSDISNLASGTDRAELAAYLRRFCMAYDAE